MQVLVGVAPARLAAPTRRSREPASVADQDHQRVAAQALEWQTFGGQAIFLEMGAATKRADENRMYELVGQMASVGEQIALARAAGVEVALWREVRDATEPDAEHEMSMRAMAEAQCLFVIGTGHALANVAVRALCLDRKLRAELAKKFAGRGASPTFEPFSERPRDWVSMNRESSRRIRAVAKASGAQEIMKLIEPVAAVGLGKAWCKLVARRGEDFHRWRPQTHGIEGVPRRSPWKRDGEARVLALGHRTYTDAVGRADETANLADDVMLMLAVSMEAFMSRWSDASTRLAGAGFEPAH